MLVSHPLFTRTPCLPACLPDLKSANVLPQPPRPPTPTRHCHPPPPFPSHPPYSHTNHIHPPPPFCLPARSEVRQCLAQEPGGRWQGLHVQDRWWVGVCSVLRQVVQPIESRGMQGCNLWAWDGKRYTCRNGSGWARAVHARLPVVGHVRHRLHCSGMLCSVGKAAPGSNGEMRAQLKGRYACN